MAMVPVLGIVYLALASSEWDPTVFVGFGEDATATTEYAEERLGEVILRESQGHDGKYFFVQANDPWVREPAENAAIIDHPVYRSQRMLYPILAGGLGAFSPEAIVWGMILVNVVAMAIGTLGTTKLAVLLGGTSWWGLAFPANIGLLYALTSDVSDIWAAALAIWAVLYVYRDRVPAAIALLTLATLSREVMVLSAFGAAAWLWIEGRRKDALLTATVPSAVIGIWILYLRAQLGPDETSAGALGLPFYGLIRAIPTWLGEPLAVAAGLGTVAILALFSLRWARTRTPLGWSFIGFVPLAVMLTSKVWHEVFDFSRALAPLVTAAVLLIFVETKHTNNAGSGDALEARVRM